MQQIALVLEVHVERRTGDARLGDEALHAHLGKAVALVEQSLDDPEEPSTHLIAPLCPGALMLARDRGHGFSHTTRPGSGPANVRTTSPVVAYDCLIRRH